MEFFNNEFGMGCETQPIVSQQHYPNTQLDNCNLKNENTFAEPTEQIFEVPPHQLFDFLREAGLPDGWCFYGSSETNLNVTITWRATLKLQQGNIEIKELKGRACTKGQVHKDGAAWLQNYCESGTLRLKFGGAK